MPHQFTIIAGSRTDRPPSPTDAADNETEIFTLPQHVIDAIENRCKSTGGQGDQQQDRQADRKLDLTKSEKPAT